LVAELQRLQVLAGREGEAVALVAVLPGQRVLHRGAVLDLPRRAPLAGDEAVAVDVPPGGVGRVPRRPGLLPGALPRAGAAVEPGDAARALVTLGRAEVGDVDRLRPAGGRVRARVAGLGLVLLRLDDLGDPGFAGVVLDVHQVDAAGAQPHHQQ